jgi:REP element-mobilizing transposase RayT
MKYVATPDYAYHVWARCLNKEWFELPMDECWRIFSNYLYFLKIGFNFKIHAFVLMDNHYHGIFQTPDVNLCQGMNYFGREVSREIGRKTGRVNQIFGGPYGRSILTTYNYSLNAYKYVYRNPIVAGLCLHAEEYKYSTLNGLLGLSKLTIPIEDDITLFSDVEGTLRWINQEYPSLEVKETIKCAMKKNRFKLPQSFKQDEVF